MKEKKSFLETLGDSQKPESFSEEKFEKVKNKSGLRKIIAVAVVVIIVAFAAYAINNLTGTVKVPDFIGKTLEDATVWAQNNGITLYAKDVYSFKDAENTILSQEVKPGEKVKKKSTIPIEVSIGADPEEVISFPDLESMTAEEIEKWISDNKLTGAKIATVYSDVVDVDHVIDYTFTDGSEDSFKRKNRVTINISLGPETISETVTVTDFSSMKAAAVLQWGTTNKVAITLAEDFDNYTASGSVISQSIAANTEIKRTQGITVVISKGKPITVPSFSGMTKEEAGAWAKQNNVTVTILDRYSNSVMESKLFSQSSAAGDTIAEGNVIIVYCSLGKVEVSSFVGKTKLDMLNWQNDVNSKGAQISLVFTEAKGDKGTSGKIISQSIQNDVVNTDAKISAVVSKGMNQVEVSSFIGKTRIDILNWQKEVNAENANIKLKFTEAYGEKGSSGKIINQSIKNDYVDIGSEIQVVMSKGMRVIIPDFSGKTEAECNTLANSSGISILFDYVRSSTVTKGFVVSQDPLPNSVTTDADAVTIQISSSQLDAGSVIVPDFSSMKPGAILQWGTDNGVKVNLLEIYDNYVTAGSVISQSISKNKVIKNTEYINIYVSLGKAPITTYVSVADFSTMTRDEANSWAKLNNVALSIVEKYSNTLLKGKLNNQSHTAGISVSTGTTVKVYYSLGKVQIGDFATSGTKTKLDAINWQSTVNDQGGNITIEFVNSSGPITNQELKVGAAKTAIANDVIDVGSTIVFTLANP